MNTPMCSTWRTGADGCIGVVLYYCRVCRKSHGAIGVASGENSARDAHRIANYGARMTFREAKGFFPTLTRDQFTEKDCA